MLTAPLIITPRRAILIWLEFIAIRTALYVCWWLVAAVLQLNPLLAHRLPESGGPASFSAITILAGWIVMRIELRRSGITWQTLWPWGFRPVLLIVPVIALTVGAGILISELDNLTQLFWPAPDALLETFAKLEDPENPFIGLVAIAVVAPVVEELIFRGLILHGLLRVTRPWVAIAISTGLFAIAHLNPWQLGIAIGLGVILGWIYYRTASLALCIGAHMLNNTITFFADSLPGYNAVNSGAVFQPWWFDFLGVVLLLGGVVMFRRLARSPQPLILRPSAEPPLLTASMLPPVLVPNAKSIGAATAFRDNEAQMSTELVQLVTSLAQRARAASLALGTAPREKKDAALEKLADLIDASHFELFAANQRDLLSPEAAALTPAARERLTLDEKKLRHLANSVREVVALPDPVGEVLEETTRPNGLRIRKIRVPIGVIGIIYEARPNVTVDCAILCLKSGNASILRGGKECFHTNMALAGLIQSALTNAGLPADAVQLVPTTDRAALNTLLKLDSLIHLVIPRGGEPLIRYVAEHSTIPVIKHYKGVCFVYVDAAADLAMAEAITLNAKVSRPSVCNAAEQLLVHRDVAEKFLPPTARALVEKKVELRCDPASGSILARDNIPTRPAAPADFTTEFLDYVIAVRVVDSLDQAIATINRDSSNHSDAIVTADEPAARRFLAEVDSATVYWNASTRFTDGYEFGYGAEIGISTDRLHARGPMGLPELCSYKYVIEGTGQVRE